MDFYDYTPAEINDIILSCAKQREYENRTRAVFAWHTAYLTGCAVNSPERFPRTPERHFTWLSGNEPDWKRAKEQMRAYAEANNKKYKGGDE